MVVACLLLFIPKPSPVEAPIAYGVPPIRIGTTTRVNSGTALAFGPSIQMDASATIRVRQANESGTVIDLNEDRSISMLTLQVVPPSPNSSR